MSPEPHFKMLMDMATIFSLFFWIFLRYLSLIYQKNCLIWDLSSMIMQILFWKIGAYWELVILTHFSQWVSVCTFYLLHHHLHNPIFYNLMIPNLLMRQSRESAAVHGKSLKVNVLRVHLAKWLIHWICQMSQFNKNLVFLLLFTV